MKTNTSQSKYIRKMADLLRAGATMLSESCPICGSPLFKLKSGEIVCPIHGRVHVVSSDEEASRITLASILERLEDVMAKRISKATDGIALSENQASSEDYLRNIILMLEIIERVERVKKELKTEQRESPRRK